MAKTKIDKHLESLARLYLRLKGYISSNLILHSDQEGKSKSELDIVAVRMPHHSQEYRWVNVPDYLECSTDHIEIILADVKNTATLEKLKFNKGLRKDKTAIAQLIDWLGMYKAVTPEILTKFQDNFNLHRKKDVNGFTGFQENLPPGNFNFKFTFFCPSLPPWDGTGFKYVDGQEMIDFAWECLNESRKIKTCSRRYDFGGWNELKPYATYFKGTKSKVTLEGFKVYCTKINL